MHRAYILENMENKFYFEEGDGSTYSRSLDVLIYRASDDELIGVVEILYNDDKINNKQTWKIESTNFEPTITIDEADEAMDELIRRANHEFNDFANRCHDDEDYHTDGNYWFV